MLVLLVRNSGGGSSSRSRSTNWDGRPGSLRNKKIECVVRRGGDSCLEADGMFIIEHRSSEASKFSATRFARPAGPNLVLVLRRTSPARSWLFEVSCSDLKRKGRTLYRSLLNQENMLVLTSVPPCSRLIGRVPPTTVARPFEQTIEIDRLADPKDNYETQSCLSCFASYSTKLMRCFVARIYHIWCGASVIININRYGR